ncbi:hypothetical protein JCM33374_g1649 [Metschnikowia sp. JCM 33374]|nr:hypothetical protein JCM33374_g1649 [Metschnikowia sp. JCM 33374]
MSLSPNGRDAVLAGRKGLFVIDLDDPFTPPRWLHHITSWEVADVQWSPHHHVKPSWCVSTSNQKALLWDLARPATNAIQTVLHRHTRAITDLHFHPQDPELLATCSIDTFVFTWDMRTPRRPINKYAQWRAGATQVKWSSSNPHQLASSHHHSFYVWDARKGASPMLHIDNAHGGKINGLDFSGTCDRLVTCSNDHSIKFWDIRNLAGDKPKSTIVIHTDYPVARARRLPFGNDNCCGIMPVRGGGDGVHIVNYKSEYRRARSLGETVHMDAIPDYSFKGHTAPLKDFLWRKQHGSYAGFDSKRSWPEYQLVTWSPSDFDLKLWPHDRKLYDIANYNPQHQVLLGSVAGITEDSPLGNPSPAFSQLGTPELERTESSAMENILPVTYNSYVSEPETSFADFSRDSSGDFLSKLASYTIKKSHKSLARSSQLNHLSWISGVRMGRQLREKPDNVDEDPEEDEGPANLGEEISIVGHKFSKLRFEKISVSTGHIEISLRGPLPALAEEPQVDVDPSVKGAKTDREKRDSISEVSNPKAPSIISANPTNSGAGPTGITPAINMNINSVSGVNQNIPLNTVSVNARQTTSSSTASPSTRQGESNANANTSIAAESTQEQKLIFIRLEIKFPKSYPFLEPIESKRSSRKQAKHKKSNQIRFDIEETHELNAAVKRDMLQHLNEIAQFYANKYHKYCLEPCLRYLMGEKIDLDDSLMTISNTEEGGEEQDATESIMEIGNENWVDDLIDQHEAAASFAREMIVSADEEDDEDADLIFGNNDKLNLSLDSLKRIGSLETSKAEIQSAENKIKHDSTPLPKGCGAVWTRNGELVCFFIPKSGDNESTSKSLQKSSVFKFTENGFGLKTSENKHTQTSRQPSQREQHSSGNGIYVPSDSDSDQENNLESDNDTFSIASGSSSSSNDSFSNDWDEMLQDDIPSGSRMPGMFRATVALGRRIRIDGINKTPTGRTLDGKESAYKSSGVDDVASKSTRKTKKGKRGKSVVSIFDFKHLIPDKYELACDYRVLGDSPEVIARHNSEVAFHHGYDEIGRVWRIVEMLLVKEVRLRDLTEVGKDFFHERSGTSCDFYWGNHPMGHSWLINELFEYFEKRRDLQMLAMLSCLLFENLSNVRVKETKSLDIPIHTPYPSLPPRPSIVSMREHGLLSSDEVFTGNESLKSTGTDRHRSISRKPSILSTRDMQFSRPISPDLFSDYSRSMSSKNPPMSSSQLGSPPFVDSFSQGKTLDRNTRSFDNSKLFSRFSSNARKGSKGVLHKGRGSVAFQNQRERAKPPPSYTIEIKNADSLDLYENVFSSPLLSGIDQQKILEYREQYAEMLYTWGLPLHRIKILKFNYPQGAANSSTNAHYDVHKCSYGARYRKSLNNKQSLITPITPIQSAKENAWNTKKRNALQYCGYCGLIVSKRVVICTKCEHIVHSHCAAEWWATDDQEDAINECPTGCGCSCLMTEVN